MDKKTIKSQPKTRRLDILTRLGGEKSRNYTMLILTFIASSLFGFFAINPTVSTIVDLKRQVADSELVNQKLDEKRKNLIILQQKYTTINQEPILAAIPKNPQISTLVGQIQNLARNNNLAISKLQTYTVQLPTEESKKDLSFAFSLEAQSNSSDSILRFLSILVDFNRIVTIDSVSVTKATDKSNTLQLTVRGKAYFKT